MRAGGNNVTQISFRVDRATKRAFERALIDSDVNASAVLQDAMRAYIQNHQTGARENHPPAKAMPSASVASLAAHLGLGERSVRSAIRRNEIPHIRLGKRIILPRHAIAEWLKNAGREASES